MDVGVALCVCNTVLSLVAEMKNSEIGKRITLKEYIRSLSVVQRPCDALLKLHVSYEF